MHIFWHPNVLELSVYWCPSSIKPFIMLYYLKLQPVWMQTASRPCFFWPIPKIQLMICWPMYYAINWMELLLLQQRLLMIYTSPRQIFRFQRCCITVMCQGCLSVRYIVTITQAVYRWQITLWVSDIAISLISRLQIVLIAIMQCVKKPFCMGYRCMGFTAVRFRRLTTPMRAALRQPTVYWPVHMHQMPFSAQEISTQWGHWTLLGS